MPAQSNEEIIRAYSAAHERQDLDALDGMRDPAWIAEMPQSGERIRGSANDRAIAENWPGGHPEGQMMRIVGSEDRWVVTPSWIPQRIVGNGDVWWMEAKASYPDGSQWYAVILIELQAGKVLRERWYFGQPFETPAWRAPWVEQMTDEERFHDR
jgi:hypothetical protein